MPLTPEPQRPIFILVWIGFFSAAVGLFGASFVKDADESDTKDVQASEQVQHTVQPSAVVDPIADTKKPAAATLKLPTSGEALEQVKAEILEVPPISAAEINTVEASSTRSPQRNHSLQKVSFSPVFSDSTEVIDSSPWIDLNSIIGTNAKEKDQLKGKARIRLERWRNGLFMARLWLDENSFADLRNQPEVIDQVFNELGVEAQDSSTEDQDGGNGDSLTNNLIEAVRNRGGIEYLKNLSPSAARRAFANFLANQS